MIQNCNEHRVLKAFMNDPLEGFSLRGISEMIKLGLPSVSRYVRSLYDAKLVRKEDVRGNVIWFANRESESFKKRKIAEWIVELEDCGLLDFLDEKLSFPSVILFGSCALGEDIMGSDLDLCIVSEEKSVDLEKFEKKIGRDIQVFEFNRKKFLKLEKKNNELWKNIINGVVLRGRI